MIDFEIQEVGLSDQPERVRPSRRFRLVDLIVIVGASAFSLWLYRVCVADEIRIHAEDDFYNEVSFSFKRGTVVHWIDWLFAIGFTAAVPCGVSLLLLGFIQPRLPFRERFRQPGLLACLIASILFLQSVMSAGLHDLFPYALPEMAWSGDLAPSGVMTCWTTLLVAEKWGGPADWVERSARVVGSFWLLAWVFRFLENAYFGWFTTAA